MGIDKFSGFCYNNNRKRGKSMNIERLIENIMVECQKNGEPVTRAEAEEMAKMEIAAAQNRRYEKSGSPRKPTKKERKIDQVKKRILANCRVLLEGMGAEVTATKTETEIRFWFEDDFYTLRLIKHRPKK